MQLSRSASFALLVALGVVFLASSAAPTPLYPVYAQMWQLSPITLTLVFGIYAIAVLSSLLVVGGLSDYIGRRRVLLVATLVQAATMIVFATASGTASLMVARVLQGLATGAAAGALGAALLDLDRDKGTVANAVSPMFGSAVGGLLAGLLVQYLPLPTVLVYIVVAVALLVLAAGLAVMPETVAPRPGALASLRPHFGVPRAARHALLVATPALVAAWALAGFYFSLGPALVRTLVGTTSLAIGGILVFVLAGSGSITVLALHRRAAKTMLTLGTSLLIVGVAITLVAFELRSAVLLFAGGAIAGAGFGAAMQGAIRSVVPLAGAHERAGLLSVVYVIAYLAMGAPAVLGGIRVMHGGGLWRTATEYGVSVIILAALALVGTLVRVRPAALRAAALPE